MVNLLIFLLSLVYCFESPITVGKSGQISNDNNLWPYNCVNKTIIILIVQDYTTAAAKAKISNLDASVGNFEVVETPYRNLSKVVETKCKKAITLNSFDENKIVENNVYSINGNLGDVVPILNYVNIHDSSFLLIAQDPILAIKQELFDIHQTYFLDNSNLFSTGIYVGILALFPTVLAINYAFRWLSSIN